jgi:hypothetical protein
MTLSLPSAGNCMDERSSIWGIGPITIDPSVQNAGIGAQPKPKISTGAIVFACGFTGTIALASWLTRLRKARLASRSTRGESAHIRRAFDDWFLQRTGGGLSALDTLLKSAQSSVCLAAQVTALVRRFRSCKCHHPIGFPGLASVIRESLFESCRIRRDVHETVANQNHSVIK